MLQPGQPKRPLARTIRPGSWRTSLNTASAKIDEIGYALDRYAAGTSLKAGIKSLRV
jgi:hypothetical protein